MKTKILNELQKRFEFADIYDAVVNGYQCIVYNRVTSSYENGPDPDYSEQITNFLAQYGYNKVGYHTTGCDERNYENYESYLFSDECF